MMTTAMTAAAPRATGRRRPPGRFWLVAAAAPAAIGLGAAAIVGGGSTSPAAGPIVGLPASPPPLSPPEPAEAALDQLVRDYEAAVSAAFLDPAIEPAPVLDDYLRSPALDRDIVQLMGVQPPDGLAVTSHETQVHAVTVTALDLSADPPSATVEECSSITATGVDEQTGERITLDEANALTTWSAALVEDGRWRLYEAVPQGPGTC
jgi:hypothetical protein